MRRTKSTLRRMLEELHNLHMLFLEGDLEGRTIKVVKECGVGKAVQ